MINVTDVAYALFQSPDLDKTERFFLDFGLTRSARTETTLYMRCSDGDHHQYIAELGDPKFIGFAFNAASETDLIKLARVDGVSEIEELTTPGGGKRVSIVDPDGFIVEVIFGMRMLPKSTQSNNFLQNLGHERKRTGDFIRLKKGPAQCKRLGHVVLNVTDFKKTDDFYKSYFGLLSSDECYNDTGDICLTFNRVNRGQEFVDHHSLLTVPAKKAGLGHIAFEVHDLNHIYLGHEHLRDNGYKHSWGIGRHVLGSQIFDYWFDPNGFRIEHWTDGDLLNADTPMERSPITEALNVQWGVDRSQRAT